MSTSRAPRTPSLNKDAPEAKLQQDEIPTRKVLGLIFPIYGSHRLRLLLGLLALVAVNALQLTIPRLLKQGIDALSQGTAGPDDLLPLALLICLIGVLATLFRFSWRLLIIGFSRILERELRQRIFDHVLAMDEEFFTRYSTGAIMAHGANDLAAVQMACGMGIVAATDALVMALAATTLMTHIHPGLTLLAILPLPVLALSTRFLSRRLHHRFDQVQEQFSRLTEFARSSIASIRLLKAYTLEDSQRQDFAKLGLQYVKESLGVAMIQGLLFPIATLVGSCAMLLVLLYGGRLVIEGTITIGDFVAFITYLAMLIWPMMAVGWVANLSQRGMTSLRRIFLLLSVEPASSPAPPSPAPNVPRNSPLTISLRDLSFHYPNSKRIILASLTLEITPGILGITGPIGCGKSTLCRLLTRLYPLPRESLFLAGIDVCDVPPPSMRGLISYVSQETFLFSTTLRRNIAFGDPRASLEQVEEAAKAAAIHDEIMAFPEGYNTIIGENGLTLSGGQRGRVALARALLCKRPLIILDDCLAAVDIATEQVIMDHISPWLRGKTVIWVSQRIKQLSSCTRILVLEGGRIDDVGSYAELLVRNTFIKDISRRQRLLNRVSGHA